MAIHGKSNAWTTRVSCSAGPMNRGRTDEVLTRNALVPVPIFMLGFSSSGAALSGVTTGARPAPALLRPQPPQAKTPSEPPREPSEPPAGPAAAADEAAPGSDRRAAPRQSDGIDLIIDKLPRHGLVKPIPVTIAPLGDRVFVASTPDLDVTVTGNSLSDALLLLKQQLETTYEALRDKASTKEQERQLSRLRAYIQDNRSAKPGW
jgi:predicted RNase H-like HicB family nuclease